MFWMNISPPSSGFKSKPRKKPTQVGGKLSLPFAGFLLVLSSVLKMEAICSIKNVSPVYTVLPRRLYFFLFVLIFYHLRVIQCAMK
jgi:hypothetical protein